MAKSSSSSHKPGDKITSGGKEYTYTQGGHWRGSDGKLFGGGKGDPSPDPAGPGGGSTYQTALNTIAGDRAPTLQAGLTDLANGDKGIEKGFQGGAEIGASLFAPGSLGRVDETASPEQSGILQNLKDKGNWNAADSAMQPSIDRAENAASSAQTLNPELQNVLALRRGALGGLSSAEMTAEKEQAQAGFDQSLTSGIRALRVGQGGRGPQGAAANIGATPLTAQFAQSNADLARKLILDNYQSRQDALNSYSNDAQNINAEFDRNRVDTNKQASDLASGAIADRQTRYNNYVSYATGLRNDLYGRQLQNLNTIAAEKSGQAAAVFGGGSFASQQEGQQQTFELGKENLDLQKQIYGSQKPAGSGGGTSGGTSPGQGNQDVFG